MFENFDNAFFNIFIDQDFSSKIISANFLNEGLICSLLIH